MPIDSLPFVAADFQKALSTWFQLNKRDLPWRRTKNPYHIWLSEVILQQTRVDQGLPYFLRFIERFPSIEILANASLDDVLQQWEGLGYYSRARNLRKAARFVVDELGGQIPSTYDSLLSLPGVGPYTAAAISSIAFDQPHAVVDGNVIRVLSRLISFSDDVSLSSSKARLQELANLLLDSDRPGSHNEGLMELGALVCTPNPDCKHCPVNAFCSGFKAGNPTSFPVKRAAKKTPHFDIAVGVIEDEMGRIYVQKRREDGMLGGLWEFPGGKQEASESLQETCRREVWEETGMEVKVGKHIASINHSYSHFRITLHAFSCAQTAPSLPTSTLEWEWVVNEHLQAYAFPKANRDLINILTDLTSLSEGNQE
ncbi:MAG: A/G-specific adenine glycosylase [Bacteroidetes bacterium]|nr:A/G-specific adenine glycosylase [Bacteroidota bacterium]